MHANLLIHVLVIQTKVNNLSISIANVHLSVYKILQKICIGYFYKKNCYHTAEYILNKYRLIHVHFHVGLVIIPRPPYWPETESRSNMGRGMITRPIWKCPCIKLFITYFQHLEKETHILAWDEVEAHVGSDQYGPRYGNNLLVIQ